MSRSDGRRFGCWLYVTLAMLSLAAPNQFVREGPGWIRIAFGLVLLWAGPLIAVTVRRELSPRTVVATTVALACAAGIYVGLTSAGYDSRRWNRTHIEGAVLLVAIQASLPLWLSTRLHRTPNTHQ